MGSLRRNWEIQIRSLRLFSEVRNAFFLFVFYCPLREIYVLIYYNFEVYFSVPCREIYFIQLYFAGEKKKTKAINNELNPVWNEVSD